MGTQTKIDRLESFVGDPERAIVEEFIHVDKKNGAIYRETWSESSEVWTILINKNRACGWYYVDSPFVSSDSSTGRKVFLTNGSVFPTRPSNDTKTYHIDNISYHLWVNSSGYEEITLFLSSYEHGPIATLNPFDTKRKGSNSFGWSCNGSPAKAWDGEDLFENSQHMRNLPFYNPISYGPYGPVQSGNEQDYTTDYTEECRPDPWTGEIYTKEEFIYCYSREIEWDIQDPWKILKRKKINDLIFRYNGVLPPQSLNYLLDKMIETFM